MKTVIQMMDKQIKELIKIRCQNDKFCGADENSITQIKILMKHDLGVSATVYSKKWAPEQYAISLQNKMYANEFLYLQKIGFDLSVIKR